MLDGDPRRVRMVYSLLFSLPGTPMLFYGEEIGMGEDLVGEGRLAVRTPMQWTAGPNGGFSRAPAAQAAGAGGDAAGSRRSSSTSPTSASDPDSLLSFMKLLIRRQRECPELGWGAFEVLDQPHAEVLAHLCTWDDGSAGRPAQPVGRAGAGAAGAARLRRPSTGWSTCWPTGHARRSTTRVGWSSRWRATATAGCGWSSPARAGCSELLGSACRHLDMPTRQRWSAALARWSR